MSLCQRSAFAELQVSGRVVMYWQLTNNNQHSCFTLLNQYSMLPRTRRLQVTSSACVPKLSSCRSSAAAIYNAAPATHCTTRLSSLCDPCNAFSGVAVVDEQNGGPRRAVSTLRVRFSASSHVTLVQGMALPAWHFLLALT